MLSKEEIEEAKGWLSALDIKSEYGATLKEILLQYIEQLETKEQKLIEKLEEDIKYGKEFESDLEPTVPEIRAEYAQEILEITKGEKE